MNLKYSVSFCVLLISFLTTEALPSEILLQDNGYENIRIVVHSTVEEDPNLLVKIKVRKYFTLC